MQVLPGLEELRGVYQGVVGALVNWDTRRQTANLESRKAMETRLQSPRIAGIPHESQDLCAVVSSPVDPGDFIAYESLLTSQPAESAMRNGTKPAVDQSLSRMTLMPTVDEFARTARWSGWFCRYRMLLGTAPATEAKMTALYTTVIFIVGGS